MSSGAKCRVCGCTDNKACTTADGPCYWIEPDLCSACTESLPSGSVLRADDMEALQKAENVTFNLPATHIFMLLSLIQLALRHVDLSDDEFVVQFGELFGRQLQEKISVTSNLSAVCEAGWPKQAQLEIPTQIILPPGYGQ